MSTEGIADMAKNVPEKWTPAEFSPRLEVRPEELVGAVDLSVAVAFTGHRPEDIPEDRHKVVRQRIANFLGFLHKVNPAAVVISGMARGVDTWAAEQALALGVPLVAAVPFRAQASKWNRSDRQRYADILANPLTTTVVVTEGPFTTRAMHARNAFMVKHCRWLFPVYSGKPRGGTYQCLMYAKQTKPKCILLGLHALEPGVAPCSEP